MTDIVKVEDSQQLAKLDSFQSVEDMLGLAQVLINSGLVPSTLNTPEKVVTVIQQGREIGFGAVTSVNNINNIQGRPTLSVHAITAKTLQKGIKFKTICYFEDVLNAEGLKVNKKTTIRFYTPLTTPIDGEYWLADDVTFTWKEAMDQGLTTKSNWKKMPAIMLYTRCFTLGARRVAGDAILGMYETSEAADFLNVDYSITEEGAVTILP